MIFKGLRFGMLLQLAVGPLCVLTFRTAAQDGFFAGMLVMLSVALADALFITLSGLGAAAALRGEKAQAVLRWAGCLVLCLFGVNIILGALELAFLPEVRLFGASGGNHFAQGFFLTASNPLTIVFWGGVLTAQIAHNHWNRRQLVLFAAGCVLSTVLSLTVVAALGSVLSDFLPMMAMKYLNIAVGAVLIFYGVRLLLTKKTEAQA